MLGGSFCTACRSPTTSPGRVCTSRSSTPPTTATVVRCTFCRLACPSRFDLCGCCREHFWPEWIQRRHDDQHHFIVQPAAPPCLVASARLRVHPPPPLPPRT